MGIKKLDFVIDSKKLDFMTHAKKMFGQMQTLLKDPRVDTFSISVKFHLEGNDELRTISMEGERSANGGWNTRVSRNRDSRALESPEILREKLSSIVRSVCSYIVENKLGGEWSALMGELKEAMKSGLSTDDLEHSTEIPIRAIGSYGYGAHLYAPLMAAAYVIEGAVALAENNPERNPERASYCVERGLYWSSQERLIPNPNQRFSERAGTGGHGKDVLREPVKDKVTELLVKLAPEEGWKSTKVAIKAVSLFLIDNHSDFVEKCWLKSENLPTRIAEWVRADPDRFPHRIRPKA